MKKRCPTCGESCYGEAVDCKNNGKMMLVDTCITARGNGGYCAHHPADVSLDFGPVYPTRAQAARNYAAYEWGCDEREMTVRKVGQTRYRVAK